MTMGKFSDWAERGCDLVLLNLLWLGCCLPIITMGPATTALHYVTRKMAAGEPYTVWRGFWGSFRDNWKQAGAAWLLLTAFTGLCGANLYLGGRAAGTLGTLCRIAGVLGLILAAFTWAMVFPVLARYTQKTSALLKNAVTLSLMNPHVALLGWAAALLFPALALTGDTAAFFAVPLWALLGGTLPALVTQLLLRPVFRRLEQPRDGRA